MTDLVQRWEAYCLEAQAHECAGRIDAAWACLEAAHIVGQKNTRLHASTHARMLGLAWRTHNRQELVGQAGRLIASILITWVWVPAGNSGRSNISALSSAPLPRDLVPADRACVDGTKADRESSSGLM